MPYINLPPRPLSSPDSPVLVAIVPRKKDMRILKREHWYRIPVKFAPKGRADYLALYLSREFGEEGKSISCYTRIIDTKIVKRRELLPDERFHSRAEEEYYKLELGNIFRTPHKIYNETGRRVIFLFTTLQKLKKAKEITDLYTGNPIEDLLWKRIKKELINASPQHYIFDDKGKYLYKLDFAMICKKGRIDVECDGRAWHERYKDQLRDRERDNYLASQGWIVLRFPAKEIFQNLSGCIERIKETVKSLGGQI